MARPETALEDTHGPRVPRSSVELLAKTMAEHRAARRRRAAVRGSVELVVVVVALWGANAGLVGHPVRAALAADTATAGVLLHARFQWFVDPTTLVLDLQAADPAAPERAFRGLLVAAAAMRHEGRPFGRVVLARAGTPVYVLSGEDFLLLGGAFGSTRNPLDVLRSIAPLLRGTAGSSAYGLLGASLAERLGERDVNVTARRWLGGMAR